MAIDTRPAERAPVHVMDYEDPSDEPITGSIGELVALWIEAMRSGAWTYDASKRIWRNDGRLWRAELRQHPYVRDSLF